jgi:hypothetical protein
MQGKEPAQDQVRHRHHDWGQRWSWEKVKQDQGRESSHSTKTTDAHRFSAERRADLIPGLERARLSPFSGCGKVWKGHSE